MLESLRISASEPLNRATWMGAPSMSQCHGTAKDRKGAWSDSGGARVATGRPGKDGAVEANNAAASPGSGRLATKTNFGAAGDGEFSKSTGRKGPPATTVRVGLCLIESIWTSVVTSRNLEHRKTKPSTSEIDQWLFHY